MGTRSATGYRLNGKTVLAYNQYDGFFDSVGSDVVSEILADIRKIGYGDAVSRWKSLAEAIKIVSDAVPPTDADIKALAPFTNLSVSEQSTDDWYCLVRELQGTIIRRLESGYILDDTDFLGQSGCEYAYILDLDAETFEVYKSGTEAIATIPLKDLPEDGKLDAHLVKIGAISAAA